MASRKYNIVWRILAGLVSVATAYVLVLTAMGMTHGLDWSGALGALAVLVLLPPVAITGRVPAQLERLTRLMSDDR